jgi:hypothetical protein
METQGVVLTELERSARFYPEAFGLHEPSRRFHRERSPL